MDVQSPNMEEVVKAGVELDRHYVYKYCSPTRSAVQSGRNPIHVNALNLSPDVHNPDDPVSGYAAVPRNMTGMATHEHTPHGRGYLKSLHYFHHANDYWTSHP